MPDVECSSSHRRRRWTGKWLARDSAVVAPLAALAVLGDASLAAMPVSLQSQVHQVLTLLAVAGAVAAALMVSFAGRLDGDAAALRVGSALFVYGGLVLPLTAVGFATTIGPVGQMLELLALGSVAALFTLALFRPGEPTLSWPAAAVAVAVSLATVASTALVPALAPAPSTLTISFGVLALGLCALAIALALTGLRRRSVLLRRVGLGVGLLALAHAGPGLAAAGVPVPWPIAGLRPLAVAVVVAGVLPHLVAALRRQRDRDVTTALALRAATEAGAEAERNASERDHELRNLVLGLSGAAALLTRPGDAERAELGAAVSAELGRLTRMLDTEAGDPEPFTTVDVGAVLGTAVAVRQATGARVELDAPTGLVTVGSAEDLMQIITNLLVNCARHAPGSPIRVSAGRFRGTVRIVVRDRGPGLSPSEQRVALTRGGRSSVTGGQGLGLAISRNLARAHGGDLRLTSAPDGPGCQAIVELPAVVGPKGRSRELARR